MSASISTIDREIGNQATFSHEAARWAAIDAQQRSLAAAENVPLFRDPAHLARIEAVKNILTDFMLETGEFYVNHRENRGKPFSVVKMERSRFPRATPERTKSEYYDPLKALGVEIVLSKGSGSMLYRIY